MQRSRVLAAVLLSLVAAAVAGTRPRAEGFDGRMPVLVELFTSEGCSSCPPADQVLASIVATQPVPDAEIIALGEHVDYWDHQGWRDRFSAAAFTARQTEYDAKVFRLESIYTPQLVIDGAQQLVGSDAAAAKRAIARAAHDNGQRVRVSLEDAGESAWRVDVAATGDGGFRAANDVMLGVTEDGLVSQVKRGENGGRELRHAAVVRLLTVAGTLRAGDRAFTVSRSVAIDPGWQRAALHIVAFVQDRRSRRVLGAAIRPIQSRGQ